MKLKHVLFVGVCAAVAISSASYAAVIRWGTSGQQLYGSDESTYLPGNRTRNTTDTGFAQLLYLGDNGTYDSPDLLDPGANGDGTHGDDSVIAQSWVGDGNTSFDPEFPGQFTASDQPDNTGYASGVADFVIRVFNTAVSDFDWTEGNIPTGVDVNYNYVEFINPDKAGGDNDYTLTIESDLSTTKQVAIPEPSTVLLFMAGLVAVIARRRRV